MKTISMNLMNYLLSSDVESTFCCDLITITLNSGLVMYATDGQIDITYGGNLYSATRWGGIHCTGTMCGLGTMNATADISFFADESIMMPNWNIPLLEAIQLGLFDAATITILTVYGQTYGDTSLGPVVRYSGQITDLQKTGRTTATGQCKPYTFTLNQPMPRQVLQPGCRWTLYDPDTCTVNKASFTYTGTVAAGSNASYVVPDTPITTPVGITLAQGVLTFTSGQNSGLSMSVQSWDGTSIRLTRSFLFPVALGDTFTVAAGCAHTTQSCGAFLGEDAYIKFGGAPFVPNYESAL